MDTNAMDQFLLKLSEGMVRDFGLRELNSTSLTGGHSVSDSQRPDAGALGEKKGRIIG